MTSPWEAPNVDILSMGTNEGDGVLTRANIQIFKFEGI